MKAVQDEAPEKREKGLREAIQSIPGTRMVLVIQMMLMSLVGLFATEDPFVGTMMLVMGSWMLGRRNKGVNETSIYS